MILLSTNHGTIIVTAGGISAPHHLLCRSYYNVKLNHFLILFACKIRKCIQNNQCVGIGVGVGAGIISDCLSSCTTSLMNVLMIFLCALSSHSMFLYSSLHIV